MMAIFYAAIPVGSALGYVIGGLVGAHLGWRWAFYLVTLPGLLLGLLCFWQRDPRVTADHLVQKSPRRSIRDYLKLFRTRSYLINCVAQTLMTFVMGGLGFWVPAYLRYRNQSPDVGMTIFGLITGSRGPGLDASGRRYCRQIALAFRRLLLLGLWNWDVDRVSYFRCGPLHSVSRSVDRDVPCDLFLIFKHRSLKHGSRQRFAACRARDGVCCKHFRHPCVR